MNMESILNVIITWAGGIAVAVLIIFLVKDVLKLVKGDGAGDLGKIIIKALSVFLIIGFMFVAKNYMGLGQSASNIGDKIVDTVVSEADKMGGSGN